MKRGRMSKKAAFELSVGTMIVIVLAVVFLILALTLVRNIFRGGSETVDDINQQVKDELKGIFADGDQSGIAILNLGDTKIARIKAGTTNFGIAIGAETKYGTTVTKRSDVQFSLELDKASDTNCLAKLSASRVMNWFTTQEISPTESSPVWNDMNDFQTSLAFGRIELNIPEGTPVCTQVVFLRAQDKTVTDTADRIIGGTSFTIQIIKKGLF